MNVIETKDISRPGNDVYFYEGVALVEQFDIYAVIIIRRISGWTSKQDVSVLFSSTNYEKAYEKFKNYRGEF